MSTVLPTRVPTVDEVYDFSDSITFVREPSLTRKLKEEHVVGHVDGLEAYKQAVYKILNTERYEYIIYSWNYGVELKDLIGKHVAYVVPELEARITEAIMQDDRTIGVGGFDFDTSKFGVVAVTFTCTCIHGETNIELNVEI